MSIFNQNFFKTKQNMIACDCASSVSEAKARINKLFKQDYKKTLRTV